MSERVRSAGFFYDVEAREFVCQRGAHVDKEPLGSGYTLKMLHFPEMGFIVGEDGKRQVRRAPFVGLVALGFCTPGPDMGVPQNSSKFPQNSPKNSPNNP